jgi:hypothetical protein
MPWVRAKKELQANVHMAAFDKGEAAQDVVETFRSKGGIKATMAVLAAHNYIKKHGALGAVYRAIQIYREAADVADKVPKLREQVKTLRHKLSNMEYLVAFAGYVKPVEKVHWPLQPRFADFNEKSGFANVMMFLAARELGRAESTCYAVASFAVLRFMKEGFEQMKMKAA